MKFLTQPEGPRTRRTDGITSQKGCGTAGHFVEAHTGPLWERYCVIGLDE